MNDPIIYPLGKTVSLQSLVKRIQFRDRNGVTVSLFDFRPFKEALSFTFSPESGADYTSTAEISPQQAMSLATHLLRFFLDRPLHFQMESMFHTIKGSDHPKPLGALRALEDSRPYIQFKGGDSNVLIRPSYFPTETGYQSSRNFLEISAYEERSQSQIAGFAVDPKKAIALAAHLTAWAHTGSLNISEQVSG